MHKDSKDERLKWFAAAARLANEWRDTASYSIVTAGTVANVFWHGPFQAIGLFGTFAMVREIFRATSWNQNRDLKVAGISLSSNNRWQYTLSAASTALALIPLYIAPTEIKMITDAFAPKSKNSPIALSAIFTLANCSYTYLAVNFAKHAGGFEQIRPRGCALTQSLTHETFPAIYT